MLSAVWVALPAPPATLVEPEASVVDAGEAGLRTAIFYPDAFCRVAFLIPDRYQERVDPVVLLAGYQLSEDNRQVGISGGAADVILAGGLVRGLDDELFGSRVIRRRRPRGRPSAGCFGGLLPAAVRIAQLIDRPDSPGGMSEVFLASLGSAGSSRPLWPPHRADSARRSSDSGG
jgi:hypothetical protein